MQLYVFTVAKCIIKYATQLVVKYTRAVVVMLVDYCIGICLSIMLWGWQSGTTSCLLCQHLDLVAQQMENSLMKTLHHLMFANTPAG